MQILHADLLKELEMSGFILLVRNSLMCIFPSIGFSVIALKFPENRERFLGLGEAISGIGLMAGPAIGAYLYNAFGFLAAFFSFAVFLIVAGIICVIFLPQSLNDECNDKDTL